MGRLKAVEMATNPLRASCLLRITNQSIMKVKVLCGR